MTQVHIQIEKKRTRVFLDNLYCTAVLRDAWKSENMSQSRYEHKFEVVSDMVGLGEVAQVGDLPVRLLVLTRLGQHTDISGVWISSTEQHGLFKPVT